MPRQSESGIVEIAVLPSPDMSDRRRFLKGLTSLPLATVLANPRLAAAVSAELQGKAKGSILLVHEWWGLV
jgi:hypothetical protein